MRRGFWAGFLDGLALMPLWRWAKCRAGRHDYFVKQVLSEDGRKIGCRCCDREWAMHIGNRIIVPWSLEFDAFYKIGTAAPQPKGQP